MRRNSRDIRIEERLVTNLGDRLDIYRRPRAIWIHTFFIQIELEDAIFPFQTVSHIPTSRVYRAL